MSFQIFMILIIIVAVLLILIIMAQNPKGGGLSSSFGEGGAQSLGGVQNTSNFLDKGTWTLALVLLGLVLLSNISAPKNGTSVPEESQIGETLDNREVIEAPIEEEAPIAPVEETAPVSDSVQ